MYKKHSADMKGHIYKTEVVLNCTPERAIAMLSPLKHYRPQWDALLDHIEVTSQIGPVSTFSFFPFFLSCFCFHVFLFVIGIERLPRVSRGETGTQGSDLRSGFHGRRDHRGN